jgi:hypothetical protein
MNNDNLNHLIDRLIDLLESLPDERLLLIIGVAMVITSTIICH